MPDLANSADDLTGVRRSTVLLTRAAFFLSGFSALVYEVVWQRVLVRLVGATTPAIALIVCIFMGGLLIGSLLGTGLVSRTRTARDQIRLFGIIELLIGVAGIVSLILCRTSFLQSVNDLLAAGTTSDGINDLLRLLLAFVFILVPTTLMGATLPVMAAFTSTYSTRPSFELGRLYACNTTGAVAGALMAGMQLLPVLGISKTLQAASSINAMSCTLAMLVAYLIASRSSHLRTADDAAKPRDDSASESQPAKEEVKEPEVKKASAATPRWLADDDDPYADAYDDVLADSVSTESETADAPTIPTASETKAHSPDENSEPPAPEGAQPPAAGEPDLVLISAVVLIGAAFSLTMEIVWTRFLILLFGSSTYALSAVLSVFITGISLGAWATTFLARKVEQKAPLFSFILGALAVGVAACLFQYQELPSLYLTIKKLLLDWVEPGFFYEAVAMMAAASFLILPAATLMGMLFPLALDAVSQKVDRLSATPAALRSEVAEDEPDAALLFGPVSAQQGYAMARYTSNLYALSIAGSIIGSAAATPLITFLGEQFVSGIEATTIAVAGGYGVCALLLSTRLARAASALFMTGMRNVVFLASIAFAVVVLRPQWNTALMSSGMAYISTQDLRRFDIPDLIKVLSLNPEKPSSADQKIIMYKEGENSIITVGARSSANIIWLKNNGKVEASLPIDPTLPAPESDLPTQMLLGLLPAVLCHNDDQSSQEVGSKGLVIGFGTGTTCGALLAAPWIKEVKAIDLERSIWLAEQHFEESNGRPMRAEWLSTNRMQPVTADARNYLSTEDEQFDFIVSQPAEPWVSGAADLYTREFYELSRKHLRPSGIFCQWLPMYSLSNEQLKILMRTFHNVYPNVYVWHSRRAGELILTGSFDLKTIKLATLSQRVNNSELVDKFERIGIEGPFDLLSNVMMSPEDVNERLKTGNQTINTDDNLIIEFSRERELSPEEMNMSTRFLSLTESVKEEAFATTPGSSMERAQALAIAERKRYGNECSTDYYYFPVLQGALPSRKAQPALKTPYRKFVNRESRPREEMEEDAVDMKLTEFRYHLLMGDLKKAVLAFQEIPIEEVKTYTGLCDVATGYFIIGDYQSALGKFQQAKELRNGTRALSGIGLSYWLLRDNEKAEEPLRQSLSRDPNQFLGRYALGQILCRAGKADEGLKNMRAASQVNPSSPLPGIFVTAFFTRKGDWGTASDNLRLVMRRKHAMLPQALALGFLIAEKSKRAEQLKIYRERFREITAAELSVVSGEKIVKEILDEPYAVRRIQINN